MSRNFKFLKPTMIAIQIALTAAAATESSAGDTNYELKPINLPGATEPVALDYFAYDATMGKLWVPASNTGSVDVIDEATDAVSQITGFPTGEIERRGRKIRVGPTSASVGDGVIYIGSRGDATVCVIDANTLTQRGCIPVSADRPVTPDGVVYVAVARELWITLRPKRSDGTAAKSLAIFDASDPQHVKQKTTISLEDLAEGYAVDNQRGLFYTNIEKAGTTVAINVRTHNIVAKWNPGSSDLQGLALDNTRRFLFVACGDHVVSLDLGNNGRITDSITTGAGLDTIDYSAEQNLLYAAASQAARLTIAEVDDHGRFHLRATVPTVKGARAALLPVKAKPHT
jgi:DNA-binding beta-propeller fold protein YncE